MAKMWKGRFKSATHPLMEAFGQSISFDQELGRQDVAGSLAHAKMLAGVGLLSRKDWQAIKQGLEAIGRDIAEGRMRYDPANEDIHMSIEAELTKRIGEPAKKLHTGRSRNDQVATDLRLWTREKQDALRERLRALMLSLMDVAARERETVIPGYTHLQRAQPVLLAHHILAYVEMFGRDRERLLDCRKRTNRLPLGSGALAGTTLPLDREAVRKELGFDSLCENSMDAVSDRDFVIETLSCLSLVAIHASRLAEDVILWTSSEWGLAKLDDAWSTGSSIMPQKRNPDLLELARGKTGRVAGALVSLLMTVKGLPMTYNRDLQEDHPRFRSRARGGTAAGRLSRRHGSGRISCGKGFAVPFRPRGFGHAGAPRRGHGASAPRSRPGRNARGESALCVRHPQAS